MPLNAALAVLPNTLAGFRGGSTSGGTPPTPPSVTTVTSGVWGAGFQNCGEPAPPGVGHAAGVVVSSGDVAGIQVSTDGGNTWVPNNIGLLTTANLRGGGVRWSRTVANKVWYYSTTATGASPGGVLWYGFYDSTIGGIVKWNQLCTVPSGVEGGLDAHPRGSKRQTIALDEANDLLYLATIGGVYKVVISTGVATLHALSGANVTSIVLDPQDRTIGFATSDQAGTTPGVHQITALPTAPSVTTRNPTDYLDAQACVPVVEGATTVLYVATGKVVSAGAGTGSVVRWNGTAFGTAGNWSDISGSINSGNTNSATRWSGIDAAAVGANTRILVTSSSDIAQASTETNAAWTLYSRTGTPTWTKPITTTNTLLTVNDGAGATWWLSSLSRSLMLDKNVYDSTCPVIDPADTSKLWLFGRSGVWRSINAGAAWYPAVKGMAVTTARYVITHPSNASKVLHGDVDWTLLASNDASVTQPITPVNRPSPDVCGMIAHNPAGTRWAVAVGDRDTNTQGSVFTIADPWGAGSWTNETITGTAAPYATQAAGLRATGCALGTDGVGTQVLLATHQGTGMLRRKVGTGAGGTWSTPTTSGVSVCNTSQNQRVHFAWPADGAVVWMLDPSTGIWQSLNRGVSWTRRQTFSGTSEYEFHLCASLSEAGVYYYLRNGQAWKITAGDTGTPVLTQIGVGVIAQANGLAVHPTSGKVIIAENATSPNGGTLWRSTDGGTTWSDQTVPSWETTCTTIRHMHMDIAGVLWIAMFAGYSKTTGL